MLAEELTRHMRAQKMTVGKLAERLGLPEETVGNWRKGRSHPRLGQLPGLAQVLRMGKDATGATPDPLYLLRRMGALAAPPDDGLLIDAADRLQKLELKLADAMERAGSYGRQGGAAGVVRAATASGRWAVAVWPAVEGTPDCPLRVADRLDIRHSDGRPTSTGDVWADPALKAALRAAYAVPARRTPRWSTDQDTSHWAISYIGAPASPIVQLPHAGVVSVSCVSLIVDSWVNDVASLLAAALGYGLTTTRDLAMEAYGLHSGVTRGEHRRTVHAVKLERPPQQRVWSHHAALGVPPQNPFVPRSGRWREDVIFIRLRESDALLQRYLGRRLGHTLDELRADRALVDEYTRNLRNPSQIITYEVDAFDAIEDRWQQVLQCVSTALTSLVDRGFLTADLSDLHRRLEREDAAVTRPLLAWLRADGCAAVS